jgi:nucleotide-binding universal stress UspA family protein
LSLRAGSSSDTDELRTQLRESAVRDAIGPLPGRACWTHEVRIGKTAEEIASVADQRAASLIILGRSQKRGVERLFVGETTTHVVQSTATPVLLVDGEISKPATIVVAVDFRAASARAAATAIKLLGESGTLYLVHVEEPVEIFPDGTTAPARETESAEMVAFDRLMACLKVPPGIVVETIVLSGSPISVLAELCDRVGADMLAVGSRRLSTMARVVLGSVSVGLARNVELPLVIAPG